MNADTGNSNDQYKPNIGEWVCCSREGVNVLVTVVACPVCTIGLMPVHGFHNSLMILIIYHLGVLFLIWRTSNTKRAKLFKCTVNNEGLLEYLQISSVY